MSEAVLDFKHVDKVAIIGAGVAGLQAASRLKIRGFDVTIFEKSDDVGGVWRSNYADFGLQVPKDLYEFYKEFTCDKKCSNIPTLRRKNNFFDEHFLEAPDFM